MHHAVCFCCHSGLFGLIGQRVRSQDPERFRPPKAAVFDGVIVLHRILAPHSLGALCISLTSLRELPISRGESEKRRRPLVLKRLAIETQKVGEEMNAQKQELMISGLSVHDQRQGLSGRSFNYSASVLKKAALQPLLHKV